jgi:hypothetical protein
MRAEPAIPDDERVLVVPLTRRDGEVTSRLLGHVGLRCRTCADLRELTAEMERGVGTIVLSEAALADPDVGAFVQGCGCSPSGPTSRS